MKFIYAAFDFDKGLDYLKNGLNTQDIIFADNELDAVINYRKYNRTPYDSGVSVLVYRLPEEDVITNYIVKKTILTRDQLFKYKGDHNFLNI